ncbi:MAG: ribonuclease PH [Candidatus Omnitrophica bacterium CG02_land_8_20_14_3_00__42_8]|nr:MAG: ribonuclease PH [Candidatus Omnitrophica bacterium CG02_land_8_20_14_3_00__42_8]PIW67239.1 MAG: ribonuclease PH [Candidatus Omnitrophica bacterium CG12_big_fil_rev_8_21_14_0_65_42_8]
MMRNDGRRLDEMRKVKIKRNVLKFAEGSCMIEMGSTKVICSASVEDKVPPFLRNTGSGWITAEYGMLPRSCKSRIDREASRGKQSGRTQEIQRLIGRSMRSIAELKKLGERTIWIDCDVIQGDGGTRTASITGSFIALADALRKLKNEKIINSIPLTDYVAAISVGVVNGEKCLDLNYEEDSGAEVDMNIIMTGSGKMVEVQGTAEKKPFSAKDLNDLINLAKSGVDDLIGLQKKLIKL